MSWAFYVGRNLTADGSVLLAGYGDEPSSHWLHREPPRRHAPGATIRVGGDATADYPGEFIEIPQVEQTYGYLAMAYSYFAGFPAPLINGGLNDRQLAVRDVMALSRRELLEMTPRPQRGLNYSDLARIALERASTAREAVEICGDLINRYGYFTYGGNSHLFADRHEGWIMKQFAGGQGLWVAQRLGPDDVRVSQPGYIGEIPVDFERDPDVLGSPNLVRFAVEQGWFDPAPGKPFNVFEAYDDTGFGNLRSPHVLEFEARLRSLAPKVSVQDMMDIQRVRGYALDSAGYGTVAHLREEPHPDVSTLWIAPASAPTAPFVPWFLGIESVPLEWQRHRYLTRGEAERHGIDPGVQGIESSRNAFYACKRLFYLVHEHYDAFMPEVREALGAFERRLIEEHELIRRSAAILCAHQQRDAARRLVTYFCHAEAEKGLRLVLALAESVESRTRLLFG